MPDKAKLVKITSSNVSDLKKVRIPGIEKSFEEMTIGELVHLRGGHEVADISVEAVSSDVSINSGRNWDKSLEVMEHGRLVKVIDQTIAQNIIKDIQRPKI